jgi:hypothetical protein
VVHRTWCRTLPRWCCVLRHRSALRRKCVASNLPFPGPTPTNLSSRHATRHPRRAVPRCARCRGCPRRRVIRRGPATRSSDDGNAVSYRTSWARDSRSGCRQHGGGVKHDGAGVDVLAN